MGCKPDVNDKYQYVQPPKTNIEPEKRPAFRGKPAFSAFMLFFWVGYTNTRLLVGGFNFFETS